MPTPRWWPRCRSTAATTGFPPRATAARSSSRSCRSSWSRSVRRAQAGVCRRVADHAGTARRATVLHPARPGRLDHPGPGRPRVRRGAARGVDVHVAYAEIPHAQHAFDFYYGSPRGHYTAQAVERSCPGCTPNARPSGRAASPPTLAEPATAPSPFRRPSAPRKALPRGGFRRRPRSSRRSAHAGRSGSLRRRAPRC